MKRVVRVSASEFFTKWPSTTYINEHYKFNVNCTILARNIGFFKDKYLLKLEGTEENIQMFLDYLKQKKFKIK